MESTNIQTAVVNLLQLVQDLGSKFSKSYLVKILKGDTKFTNAEHRSLSSYGSLNEWTENKIDLLIQFLHGKEYLNRTNHHRGNYELSERGKRYLQKPSDFWIRDYELKPSKRYYYEAYEALKEERRLQASQKGCSTYELCSNFQLQQLILLDIKSVEELNQNEVFKNWEGKVDWEKMLLVIKNVKKEYYNVKRLVRSKNYSKIEEMIRDKKVMNEILSELGIKCSTLVKYVEAMYANGNTEIKEWIYKNVSKNVLVKCIEYFTRTKNLKLREAKEKLGMDYETLRLGRLYYQIQQVTVAA